MGSEARLTGKLALASSVALALLVVLPAGSAAEPPSAELRYPKKKIDVLGYEMAYIDAGRGQLIVFLHGNPTSSYLWRNIIPHVEGSGRCLAPDLIGMGDSDKIAPRSESGDDGRYRFIEHRRFLDAFLDAFLEPLASDEKIVLVLHDWGSALGFDWARRHPDRVRGIAFMEAFLQPLTYSDMGFVGGLGFRAMRSRLGNWLILDHNLFVEQILPSSVLRGLTEAEMIHYRAPYLEAGESRRATLTWPREVPFDGEPADTHDVIATYAKWLPTTEDLPKLWFDVSEGVLVTGARRDFAQSLPNQRRVPVEGRHFVQEDAPDAIGFALKEWIAGLP